MERPHYTYFTTRWRGMRLLLAPVHLVQLWHYSLVVLTAFALPLAQQALEQAFAEHEERIKHIVKAEGEASGSGNVSWSDHIVRALLFISRIALSYIILFMAITMDVGIFVGLLAGSLLGFILFRRRAVLVSDYSLRRKIP
jgi:hypothetical protein